ncbi:hypothetical protein GCM10027082_14090 [Comamonas humi]
MQKFGLIVTGLLFCQSGWAGVSTLSEAEKVCVDRNPEFTSPIDDGSKTFSTEDRFNIAFRYKTLNVICSVGRNSGEIEQLKAGEKIISKEELKAGERRKNESNLLGDRIAAGDYQDFLKKLKNNVADKFKDPDSVKFRGLFFSNRKGMPTLCGEVNAKNSYGAYVGYRGFYANSGGEAMAAHGGEGSGLIYDNMSKEFCNSKFIDVE